MSFLFFIKSYIKQSNFVTIELFNLLKMDLSEQLKKLFPNHEVSNELEAIDETPHGSSKSEQAKQLEDFSIVETANPMNAVINKK